MLYNIGLISVIHQHELTTGIHVSLPFWISLLLPLISNPLDYYRVQFEFPESYSKLPLTIYLHMLVYMLPCYSLHSSHPLLPLRLCLIIIFGYIVNESLLKVVINHNKKYILILALYRTVTECAHIEACSPGSLVQRLQR